MHFDLSGKSFRRDSLLTKAHPRCAPLCKLVLNVTDELSKLDVARRQLVTAIRLFFDGRDEVSVYTLAANAWEVIDVLCDIKNVDSLSGQTQEGLPAGKSLKHDYINSPFRNFFKHADRDPQGVLSGFSDRKNDGVLMLAVEDFLRLEGFSPIEFQIFQLWYLAVYEEKIDPKELERIMVVVRESLPGIADASRQEQKRMGRELLLEASQDEKLLNDVRTDTSELVRWSKR